MATRRKPIPMSLDEEATLKRLYLDRQIPVDQYEERHSELVALAKDWNAATSRNESPEDVLHFMRNRRKNGQWVRLDGKHKSKPKPRHTLDAEQVETLVEIYAEHVVGSEGVGSDTLAYDRNTQRYLAREFSHRTGRRVPAAALIAKLTALRKRGLLPKVGDQVREDEGGLGFSDINEVA